MGFRPHSAHGIRWLQGRPASGTDILPRAASLCPDSVCSSPPHSIVGITQVGFRRQGIPGIPRRTARPLSLPGGAAASPPSGNACSAMKVSFAILFLALLPCGVLRAADATRLEFDFAQSDQGFTAGFADYPHDADLLIYQFTNSLTALPAYLGGETALFISGVNRSDDLFMFWKKRITGLPPNTPVVLTIELQLASMYAEGMIGAGGAPGEAVTVKAGAVPFEPQPVVAPDGWLRMSLDKGNQSVGGTNMFVIGNVAKPADGNADYVLLTRHHHGMPLTATTAGDGSLWLVFGTDSGFEGETALYYSRLTVWINRADRPHVWLERTIDPVVLRLVWNEGALYSSTNLTSGWSLSSVTTRPYVYEMSTETRRFWRLSGP